MMQYEPIPSYLRPDTLEGFVGQEHLVGEGKPVRIFLESGRVPSMIFRGPPGCGKTTMAHIISEKLEADFHKLSGVTSKKDDLKEIIGQAQMNFQYGKMTIVFLDEIHRRNKAQQDTLLPYVEKGIITLIGATTENPSFSINNALISRSRVFIFESLKEHEIVNFLQKNMEKIKEYYPDISVSEESLLLVAKMGNGDLRNSLNLLESVILFKKSGEIVEQDILNAGQKSVYYDRDGEEHYNIISAIHKSLRDGDGDAACYWIQRMLMGGEDPLYIARRLMRFASEDIGPANNNALLMSTTVYNSIQKVGMPESDVFLFHLAIYLAESPKNNVAYRVANETRQDVHKYGNLPVPMVIRNASTKFMDDLGYGKDYKYAHNDFSSKDQQHMPDELKHRKYINRKGAQLDSCGKFNPEK